MNSFYDSVKVVLCGDAGVGKTSLVNRKCRHYFSENTSSTVGTGYYSIIEDCNDAKVELKLWDTAGQEEYSSLIPMYSRGAAVCILVADLTHLETFQNLKNWEEKLALNTPVPKFVLAANKSDLFDEENEKTTLQELSDKYEFKYGSLYITSAKTGAGVDELFNGVARIILETTKLQKKSDVNVIDIDSHSECKNGSCC